jgi:hypothetical protein
MPNYVPLVSGICVFGAFEPCGLNIRGSSTMKDTEAICYFYESEGAYHDNELFELRITGEKFGGADYVFIINKNSQMALTAQSVSSQGTTVFQLPILQKAGHPFYADAQKWLQYSPDGGNGLVFKNKMTGLVLDVQGASVWRTGVTPVIQWPENDQPNQLWFFDYPYPNGP